MTAPDDDVVLAPIRRAILDLRRLMPSVRSATVTGVSPLRIQFDGEATPVSPSPTTLVPVGPGDRVRVLHYSNTHLILGRVNTKGIPYRVAAGRVQIPAGGTSVTVTATFPEGRFTTVPIVTPVLRSSHYLIGIEDDYVNSVTFRVRRADGANVNSFGMGWIAVQMTPTSAEG